MTAHLAPILALLSACPPPSLPPSPQSGGGEWREYVVRCLDTLIEHGRDTYGEVHSPLLMAVIDVRTLRSPAEPELFDSMVRLEGRLHRRAEQGSNLWYDQKTLAAMYLVSRLSQDERYARAADAYVAHAFDMTHVSILRTSSMNGVKIADTLLGTRWPWRLKLTANSMEPSAVIPMVAGNSPTVVESTNSSVPVRNCHTMP